MIAGFDSLVVSCKFKTAWVKRFANIFYSVVNEPQKDTVGGKDVGLWVCFNVVKCVKAKITFFSKLAIRNVLTSGEAVMFLIQITVRIFVGFAFFLARC